MRKFKSAAILASCISLALTLTPVTAFARVDPEMVEEEEVVPPAPPEEEPEKMGPLTPEGNLTIVDDYGDPDKSGKQFITVTTKTGNIFYIIIDRDDEGENTVHFLNLVDERDLLSLMDEEEIAELKGETEEPEPEPVVTEEPVVEEAPPEEPKKNNSNLIIFVILAILGCAGGFYIYSNRDEFIKKENKDPDEDYIEDVETGALDKAESVNEKPED